MITNELNDNLSKILYASLLKKILEAGKDRGLSPEVEQLAKQLKEKLINKTPSKE